LKAVSVFRVYRLLLDVSAVALLVLLCTYILSGYVLLNPDKARRTGAVPLDYRLAVILHKSATNRVLLSVFTAIHGITGFSMIALRIRNKALRKLALIAVHAGFTAFLAYTLVLEAVLAGIPLSRGYKGG